MISWRMLAVVFGTRTLLSLVGAVLLLAMADLAEMSRQLADQENPLGLALSVYRGLAPSLALQALPIAVLLGFLLSITDLARSRELLALRAAGAGSLRLATPALTIALVLTSAAVLISDSIAPRGVEQATRIQMETLGRMRSAWSPFHGEQQWFAAEGGGLYNVREIDAAGHRLEDLWRFDHEGGRITSVLRVRELIRDGEAWEMIDSASWRLDPHDPTMVVLGEPMLVSEAPSHFEGVRAHPEALTRRDLREAISLRKAQGQSTIPFALEAQARWTMPLLALALAIVALGLGFAWPPNTHVEATARAIGVAFAAWTLLSICRAMGLSGMISPSLAAFLPVVLPAAAGVVLLFKWK